MKKMTITANIEVYSSAKELTDSDAALLQKAREATKTAYAPYSNFRVGAAVLLENGQIFIGNNQENAAYPSCLCAERVAIFAAAATNPSTPIKALAVTAKSGSKVLIEPVTPCGSCRQVIYESEFRFKQAIRIILQGEEGDIYIMDSVKAILPLTFDADFL